MTHRLGRLWRFGLVGLATNAALLALFWLLVRAGLSAPAASVATYAVGVAGSYRLQRGFAFRPSGRSRFELAQYVLVHLAGAATAALLQWVLADRLGLPPVPVQLLAMAVVAVLTFALFDRVVFPAEGPRSPARPSA